MSRLALLAVLAACGRVGFEARLDGATDAARADAPPPIPIAAVGVFAAAASDLRRTLVTEVSRRSLTFSTWYRSSNMGTMLLCAGIADNDQSFVWADLDDPPGNPYFQHNSAATAPNVVTWPHQGMWVHLVVAVDTVAPTLEERVRWWVNGEPQALKIGDSGEVLPQNQLLHLGEAGVVHTIGNKFTGAFNWTGELAETYLIFGHALEASEFVVTVAPGVVRSIEYTGPIAAESVYFDWQVPGENRFAGQPSWTPTMITSSTTGLPY